MYCNVVVHNQAGITRDDLIDRKRIFHRNTKLHKVQQNKHVFIVAAEAVLTQTLTLMPPHDFLEEFLNILTQS